MIRSILTFTCALGLMLSMPFFFNEGGGFRNFFAGPSSLEAAGDQDIPLTPMAPRDVVMPAAKRFHADRAGWSIEAFATQRMEAVIMSKNWYRFDGFSDIIPVDLTLCWGEMSKPKVLWQTTSVQSNRWGKVVFPDGPPKGVGRNYMQMCTNMHLVTDDPDQIETIKALQEGDAIEIEGWHVELKKWGATRTSSLSRTDSLCDIILIHSIRKKDSQTEGVSS